KAPRWVPLIEAFCKYDLDALSQPSEGPHELLRNLLSFLAIENCGGSYRIISTAWENWQKSPDTLRIIDGTFGTAGVAISHRTTVAAPLSLAGSMRQYMKLYPNLPAEAKQALRRAPMDPRQAEMFTAKDVSQIDFDQQGAVIAALEAAAEGNTS